MNMTAMGLSFEQLLKLSFVIPVLLVLSIFVLAQSLERLWTYLVLEGMPYSLLGQIFKHLQAGEKQEAVDLCQRKSGTVAEAFADLLQRDPNDTDALMESYSIYRQKLQMRLSRRVGLFGTASFISPLIGLLGTVLGVMRAFHDLAAAGTGGPSVVAAGISEALIATAAGIGVAVLSSIFYNYFTMSLRYRLNLFDLWAMQLADWLKKR
ncbi:MAG: MotA/TolQ/ExbB proton channel family protein [Elusimicrobia bacterium]|nr:MotA/TolQ/ExbB proton channel family protein [Elusimicrobiota bacterium]